MQRKFTFLFFSPRPRPFLLVQLNLQPLLLKKLGTHSIPFKPSTMIPPESRRLPSMYKSMFLIRIQNVSNFLFRSQQQNRREIRMAYLTFAIVTLFFLLNLPRIALGGYEVSNTWLILRCVAKGSKYLSTLTFYRWDTISRLLMVINSSINFLIYCAGSQQFKVTLHSYS